MVVLVVSDLRRHRAALRIAHDEVVHAKVRHQRGDVAEWHGNDRRGARRIEIVCDGNGYAGSARGARTQRQRGPGRGHQCSPHVSPWRRCFLYGITNAGSTTAQKAAFGLRTVSNSNG